MDVTHADFTNLLRRVENAHDMLEWQMPSDIPTLNRVFEDLKGMRRTLRSYLDVDGESTTTEQLELAFLEVEDENGYGNW